MRKQRQSGSAHVIIIVILIIIILGALGFVFWQNFLNKPATVTDTTKTTTTTQTPPSTDDTTLSQTGTDERNGTTITFNYPKSWTQGDNSITSSDGKVTIHYTLVPPDGIGGTCGDDTDAATTTDPLVAFQVGSIPGAPQVIFASHITHYLADPNSGNPNDYYQFGFAAVKAGSLTNAKIGDASCPLFIFTDLVSLNSDGTIMLQFGANFKDLDNSTGSPSEDVTQAQIEQTFASDDAKVAQAIIQSLVIKQ